MNDHYFQKIETALATERLDAYRQDGVGTLVTLARYLWNMALCESLYSPLQCAEIALRNAIHACLTKHYGTDSWFAKARLLPWQEKMVQQALSVLKEGGKPPTPGRMVAELNFGFWTGFYNKVHAGTGLGHLITKVVFGGSPAPMRDMKKLGALWYDIRILRNRVFHHERILHWKDLPAKHEDILHVIGWISPEMEELARALDRFTIIYGNGVDPWAQKIRHHWPQP